MQDTDDCLPPLTTDQYESLRDDIAARGVQVPVDLDAATGEVLDGRARVKAAAELGIATFPRRTISGLVSAADRRHHRIRANLLRRQVDRAAVKDMVLAELRREPRSDRFLAELFAVSHTAIANWRRGFVATGKLFPVEEFKGVNGKTYRPPTSIFSTTRAGADRAANLLRQLGPDAPAGRVISARTAGKLVLAKRKSDAARSRGPLPRGVKLIHGRFQDAGHQVDSASVDLIWCDPPWSKSWLPEWADLGTFAMRVLKPGGVLVAYSPVAYLDRVLAALGGSGLDYIWMFSIANGHRTARSWGSGAISGWHCLPVFSKGTARLPAVRDHFQGQGVEKDRHAWQEGEAETEYSLTHLVPPNGVVLDPCCGSGTTLVVARRLALVATGIDQDQGALALTRARLREEGDRERTTSTGTPRRCCASPSPALSPA
jgi:site-specific DNA-methyltransferase (adenine-specific)